MFKFVVTSDRWKVQLLCVWLKGKSLWDRATSADKDGDVC